MFNPNAGEGKKEREKKGGRQRGRDGWKRGELTGESEADQRRERKKPASTYLYIKEVTLPCKFAKAHL